MYVQDGNSCVISTPLTITIATDPIPSGLTISGLSQCPSATNDYTFTVNVGSGVSPYEYSIGSGFQSSPTFTVNASGSYIVTVRDANGCTNTVPVDILPALQFSADITTLPSCSNDDGEITVTGSGGSRYL
ncbi:hypothetical protein N7U66_21105 [Lacinutrix neustonica]|uniref:SprB repeat-containing protein n=1 Tax=Lacinutrix neustonica TaxID=2980107 RepID=A0A9E8MX72_9FLAO|nr:hypothetical protein [Lacinutrix neustonica]WAC02217.1 hypothetical protein N7U66_21105 [Lacinutrix neustonica]